MEVKLANDIWDDDLEGVIVTWLYQDGAQVTKGEVICELMVEKSQFDFLAPVTGQLTIRVEADGIVTPGAHIADIAEA
jgi:2-oxoglutarate dehydrogenase E2 component (dihydrolipoamide succinyltransferase)